MDTGPRDPSNVRRIVAATKMIEYSDQALRDAVVQARAAGETWAVIGVALGVTKQSAYQRFGKVVSEHAKSAPVPPQARGGGADASVSGSNSC